MKHRILIGLGLVVVGYVALVARVRVVERVSAQENIPVAPTPNLPPGPHGGTCWLGVSSCTAASCHGGGIKGCKGSEWNTFVSCDPHTRAYKVLSNARSASIVRNLNDPQAPPADKNPLCLACHATNPPPSQRGPQFTLADGIGCESCHGPAKKWLSLHYLPAWKSMSNHDKAALGFQPTKDLVVRARVCVQCHVGSGEVEVNHDLIAAGHPRIDFENASYLSIYHPKHWSVHEEKAHYPDFEARAWAVGKLVSAQAALELLSYRAGNDSKPWPEFSEFDCYACHQSLPGSQFKPKAPKAGRPGSIAWGDWYYALVGEAIAAGKVDGGQGLPPGLDAVRSEMNKRSPNRAAVAQRARSAAVELGLPLERLCRSGPWSPALMQNRLDMILKDERRLAETNWDNAMQRYLALAALYHALGDQAPKLRDPRLKDYLHKLAGELAFPLNQDSPARKD